MRAKFINEGVENILKPKTKSEINSSAAEEAIRLSKLDADEIIAYLSDFLDCDEDEVYIDFINMVSANAKERIIKQMMKKQMDSLEENDNDPKEAAYSKIMDEKRRRERW